MAASVRQRLLTLAKARDEELEFVMVLYAVERFLHRLAASPHKDRFVLKGAMLMLAWKGTPTRPTRDLDLLGFGEISPQSVTRMIADICADDRVPDGLAFDAASIHIAPVRENQRYGGLRATFMARLGTALIPCQVDIGIGDAITPGPESIQFPSLIGMPATTLRAYPKVTVIAEKFEAMVQLGITNSRMNDFHDVCTLANTFAFNSQGLAAAILATFERRKTPLPADMPIAFTKEFLEDSAKRTQWNAFVKRFKLLTMPGLPDVGTFIAAFPTLPMNQARDGTTSPGKWKPGGAVVRIGCSGSPPLSTPPPT